MGRKRTTAPSTPSWVPQPPAGSSIPDRGYYVAGELVWFYNEESGQWESGTVVQVRGVSGSTLYPFVSIAAPVLSVD
ncbi:hypothetical protein FALBO_10481 [Fusarium albosuccineum]|uniref:Uncharacterized protein n=1 Tax=Fusarium albosuccineum TaxID=1237068 RepID=A0A8H4PIF4_9HYPO|nr:hypothetical protein FALBO_10481 [Fusarium albosuccineum]